MQHEEAQEGIDWHRDGADLPGWALASIMLATFCSPIALLILLLSLL